MLETNPFLAGCESDGAKGGGRFLEDPCAVENIIFQTRAGPLEPFEQSLAEALMAVFAEGNDDLPAVVSALQARASLDGAGRPWTEEGLAAQLARSASALFACSGSRP